MPTSWWGRLGAVATALVAVAGLVVGIVSISVAQEANDIAASANRLAMKQDARALAEIARQGDAKILRISGREVKPDAVAEVTARCVLFSGYQYNMPALGQLWIATQPTLSGRYWVNRVRASDTPTGDEERTATVAKEGSHAWRASATLGADHEPGPKKFTVTLFYATSAQSAVLEEARRPHLKDGMEFLPDGLGPMFQVITIERLGSNTTFPDDCSVGKAS